VTDSLRKSRPLDLLHQRKIWESRCPELLAEHDALADALADLLEWAERCPTLANADLMPGWWVSGRSQQPGTSCTES
jgi:hypothetical protein